MRFTKMHGIGNDYIYINCLEEAVADPGALSVRLSDRRFGVGGDGIILICRSSVADFRMRMFNADGSESEMCGNGIRCFAKYVFDKGLTRKETITVETGAGVKTIAMEVVGGKVRRARVDMGEPILSPAQIPVNLPGEAIVNAPILVEDRRFFFTAVSMGNPHCVVFVDEIDDELVLGYGPRFERHALFPARVNTEFARVISPREVEMRVWERGSGETWACGTGASAVGVAGVLTGRTERRITVHLRGGDLEIEWAAGNHVFMTGPAETVFEGTLDSE
ncbi:diaminopimelate epimerase [bacterium]|nr:diaminopimelate epimerase [bacterium]